MPGAHRLGDSVSAHGCWPDHETISASVDVLVNGIGACTTGDAVAPHTCPEIPETHGGANGPGSGSVLINKKKATRIGDPCTCGGVLTGGSSNVKIGG
jgi:uncharacterized Zn-binding protein involved in type VI secretion